MGKVNRRAGMAALGALIVAASAAAVAVALGSGHGSHDDPAVRARGACRVYDHQLLTSQIAGASRLLVPPGAHTVTLCRYTGVGLDPATARRLQAHHRTKNRVRVADLAAEFNALRPMTGVRACPDDNGTQTIAIFGGYPGTVADDPVTVDLTGCKTATNGHLVRLGTAQLVGELTALTPAPR